MTNRVEMTTVDGKLQYTTRRGRWTRVWREGVGNHYYVQVLGKDVRVPWLGWVMFS